MPEKMAGILKCGLVIHIVYLMGNQVIAGEVSQTSQQFSPQSNIRLGNSVMQELKDVGSALRCSALCCRTASCRSFNYDRTGRYCQLNRETKGTKPGDVLEDPRYKYYEMENQSLQVLTERTTAEPTSEEPNSTTAQLAAGEPQSSVSNISSSNVRDFGNVTFLASCNAIKKNGISTDGYYMIDPDGDGGDEAFQVYCSFMRSIGSVRTSVSHHQKGLATVDADPYIVNIVYNASISQIDALIAASDRCTQTIDAHCTNAKLWEGEVQVGWWVSRQGNQMPNWGMPLSEEGCYCYKFKRCKGGDTSRCNCGVVPNEMTEETAFLTEKDYLPVMALHFEGAVGEGKLLQYELGELMIGHSRRRYKNEK